MVSINKYLWVFFAPFLVVCCCNAQQNQKNTLYGEWKVVKVDYRGYQKFNIKQAKQLENSVLNIKKHTFFYSNIKFIEPCSFTNWTIKKYDTSENFMYNIEFLYTKNELSTIKILEPIDSIGNTACYNECAIFFLKHDTLINICGGYTFFLLKQTNLPSSKNFWGSGSTSKEFLISENTNSIELSYDFYREGDELIVKDQEGVLLFKTGTISTNKSQKVTLILKNVNKLIIIIRSQKSKSKWHYSITYK